MFSPQNESVFIFLTYKNDDSLSKRTWRAHTGAHLTFLFYVALETKISEGGHGKDCGKAVEGRCEERAATWDQDGPSERAQNSPER